MKYEIVNGDYSKVFINSYIIADIDFHSEKDLEKFLKTIIINIKNKYNVILKGLYQVVLYVNYEVGIVIEFERIDSFLSNKNDIDLHIKVVFDCKFYFKTKDFYAVKDFINIYYYQGYYYINAALIKDDITYVEFGEIVQNIGEDIEEIGIKVGNFENI